jgi:hypothetical protein
MMLLGVSPLRGHRSAVRPYRRGRPDAGVVLCGLQDQSARLSSKRREMVLALLKTVSPPARGGLVGTVFRRATPPPGSGCRKGRKDSSAPATEDSLDLRSTAPSKIFHRPGTQANHPDAESGRSPHPNESLGKPVRRGQLLFQNRSVEVVFDDRPRGRLLDTIAELKSAETIDEVARSHNSPARCRGCGFRQTCRDSLASA